MLDRLRCYGCGIFGDLVLHVLHLPHIQAGIRRVVKVVEVMLALRMRGRFIILDSQNFRHPEFGPFEGGGAHRPMSIMCTEYYYLKRHASSECAIKILILCDEIKIIQQQQREAR